MTAASPVISAVYATFNVLVQKHLSPDSFPYIVALLVAAGSLACTASISICLSRNKQPAQARRTVVRNLRGPGERRL